MKDAVSSPEEKLLKLIRGQKKPDTAVSSDGADTRPKLSSSLSRRAFFMQKYVSLLNINKIVGIIFIISCLYLIISFLYPLFGFKKIRFTPPHVKPIALARGAGFTQTAQENIPKSREEAEQEIKPYEFYAQGLKNRRIFAHRSVQETEPPSSAVEVDSIKDITLIGIISGDNPQAVIEDKKTQKTSYITKGQNVGEYRVEDIQEGKIILNYRGKKFELYL